MARLADVQKQVDALSSEDRAGLLAHLLHTLEGAPEGLTDQEVIERDRMLESGEVTPISHDEFISEVLSRAS